MSGRQCIIFSLVAACVLTGVPEAHHSISLFDLEHPVWISGTITSYRAANPHAIFDIEVIGDADERRQWTIEGPNPRRLAQIHALSGRDDDASFFAPGDTIEVCGFPPKASQDVSSERFVHGHVVVMPDGRLQSWGPYGQINNCLRRGDDVQLWIDFFNRDPLARGFWCGSRERSLIASIAPEDIVAAIGAGLADPCP